MPQLTCTGISAISMAGLMNVMARAMFHAVDLPELMLTAGPYTLAPACCTMRSWSLGHMPARRSPSNVSLPCMPSTNSLAMPISMPSHGYFSRSLRQAVRAARKSASPAAPVVSMSMPSVPAATMWSAT